MTGIIDRLRTMQGMGDIQLKALMDGVGPQAADEIERLRSEITSLQKEADKFDDGIDWIQRALQAEAKIEAMEKQEPVGRALLCVRCSTPFDGEHYCPACGHHTATEEAVYALPGAKGE